MKERSEPRLAESAEAQNEAVAEMEDGGKGKDEIVRKEDKRLPMKSESETVKIQRITAKKRQKSCKRGVDEDDGHEDPAGGVVELGAERHFVEGAPRTRKSD